MKTIITFALLTMISLGINAQYNYQNLRLEADAAQSRYKFGKLQLYPIRANATFVKHHQKLGSYTTLKEGLEKNKVKITEVSSGDVNKLYIENISRDTVIILSGEVVQGGKQDRMIAQDVMLYPNSGKKDVSVFCVEHGRWQSRKGDMTFKGYYTISSNEVRKAGTVQKNQQEVWNKVSETTKKNKAGSSTGTLTELKNSGDFSVELKKYTTHFENLFVAEQDVIGVVAVSGDAILGCDMFATHDLFSKHYANLMNSYATEAITSGKTITLSQEDVKKYLDKILMNEAQQDSEIQKKGTLLKDKNKKLHISTF